MSSYEHPMKQSKLDLIDRAMQIYRVRSMLDLGGCWGVNGGYIFHAIRNGNLDKAYLVDGHVTELTAERAREFPQLALHEAQLGDEASVHKVSHVDAIIMYDIILHQVAPDWDKFIEMWARRTNCLIIYNQNWTKADDVVRFVDQSVDWYIENVPHGNMQAVREWYLEHHNDHPTLNRKWRDVHYFWQFGIPRSRLLSQIEALGFRIDFCESDGVWSRRYPWISNDSILASRKGQGNFQDVSLAVV